MVLLLPLYPPIRLIQEICLLDHLTDLPHAGARPDRDLPADPGDRVVVVERDRPNRARPPLGAHEGSAMQGDHVIGQVPVSRFVLRRDVRVERGLRSRHR